MYGVGIQSSASDYKIESLKTIEAREECDLMKRRHLMKLGVGVMSLVSGSRFAEAAGLPPEEKPRLCDDECEKALENVWWDSTTHYTFFYSIIFVSSMATS